MARITSLLACLHSVVVQVPEHQYHNISRIVQPQIRSVCDVLTMSSAESEQQGAARQQPGQQRKTPATTAAVEARNAKKSG